MHLVCIFTGSFLLSQLSIALPIDDVLMSQFAQSFYSTSMIVVIPATTIEAKYTVSGGEINTIEMTKIATVSETTITLFPGGEIVQQTISSSTLLFSQTSEADQMSTITTTIQASEESYTLSARSLQLLSMAIDVLQTSTLTFETARMITTATLENPNPPLPFPTSWPIFPLITDIPKASSQTTFNNGATPPIVLTLPPGIVFTVIISSTMYFVSASAIATTTTLISASENTTVPSANANIE